MARIVADAHPRIPPWAVFEDEGRNGQNEIKRTSLNRGSDVGKSGFRPDGSLIEQLEGAVQAIRVNMRVNFRRMLAAYLLDFVNVVLLNEANLQIANGHFPRFGRNGRRSEIHEDGLHRSLLPHPTYNVAAILSRFIVRSANGILFKNVILHEEGRYKVCQETKEQDSESCRYHRCIHS